LRRRERDAHEEKRQRTRSKTHEKKRLKEIRGGQPKNLHRKRRRERQPQGKNPVLGSQHNGKFLAIGCKKIQRRKIARTSIIIERWGGLRRTQTGVVKQLRRDHHGWHPIKRKQPGIS